MPMRPFDQLVALVEDEIDRRGLPTSTEEFRSWALAVAVLAAVERALEHDDAAAARAVIQDFRDHQRRRSG